MIDNSKQIQFNIGRYVMNFGDRLNEGLHIAGQKGVGFAKESSPVLSGRMRNSMGYSIDNQVIADNPYDEDDKIKPNNLAKSVVVGTNVIYAPHVEYMSQNGSKGFMLRAFKQWLPVAKSDIASYLRKAKVI